MQFAVFWLREQILELGEHARRTRLSQVVLRDIIFVVIFILGLMARVGKRQKASLQGPVDVTFRVACLPEIPFREAVAHSGESAEL